MSSDGFLKIDAACSFLGGMSRATLYRVVSEGRLPAFRLQDSAGALLFKRQDLESFVVAHPAKVPVS